MRVKILSPSLHASQVLRCPSTPEMKSRSPLTAHATKQDKQVTRPRRSARLRQDAIALAKTRNEPVNLQSPPSIISSTLQQRLSSEIRLLIFSHLLVTERPFLIGRCQEKRGKTYGSPRDIFTFRMKSPFKARRDDTRNRPKQPPITRVCRRFREEALPLFYSQNEFWLIHNEFAPGDSTQESPPPRAFIPWLNQTPRNMFQFMHWVSLCGYSSWPNRMMISINLKKREIISVGHHDTYGDELPIYQDIYVDSLRQVLASKSEFDCLEALKALLAEVDYLFHIETEYKTSPPGMQRRQPASGWDYDW